MKNNFLICGLDRLGKDTLISGIQQRLGFYQVLHRGRPPLLECYDLSARTFQVNCFEQDMRLIALADKHDLHLIYNRAWLGEAVYAPLYRGYDGSYVFELERQHGMAALHRTRLILLTEDFSVSRHFQDDGLSFDPTRRQQEQQLFLDAFDRSAVADKKIICVTDPATGQFKSAAEILHAALNRD